MKNKVTNFKVMDMSQETARPEFRESRNGLWIDYGKDNLYPQYLLDVYQYRSNKHKAIISKKVMMASGNGVKDPVTDSLRQFLDNKWSDNDIEEIMVKCNYEIEIYGGFALQVRWSIDGSKVSAVDYLPFHKVRLSTNDNKVFISKDWSKKQRSENVPVEYQLFSPKLAKEYPTQVFYFTVDTVGQEYYPIPFYSSTLNWIELDYEIGNFHLNSVRNGFMPGFILNFATGIPSDEEMDMAYREFEKKYTGTNNANKFILTFSDTGDQAPMLTPINLNDSDERFLLLRDQVESEIFVGHSVTNPMLFGIREAGQLGGKDEMLESLAIFQATYIKYKQLQLEKQFDKIAKWAGVLEPIKLKKYEIDFEEIQETIKEEPKNNEQ